MSTQISTTHTEAIHDAQLNWSGSRLATCSSDRTIKIYDCATSISDNNSNEQSQQHTLLDTLQGHDGPVWQVSWAHPKFGNILASCSYDGKVIVWREGNPSANGAPAKWDKIKEHTLHNASVNSLAWAPHELGAILACASSDGKVSVLSFNNDGAWDASLFVAHPVGVNSISWAPATHPSSLVRSQTQPSTTAQHVKKFATGGCDSVVKVWGWVEESKEWTEEEQLEGHTDWVRDVAWAPNVGLPRTYLASASQDKTVIIHINDSSPNAAQTWSKVYLDPQSTGNGQGSTFPDTVYRLSWSVSGAVLAVSCGDGRITLWKENIKGQFELVSDIDR